MSRIIHEPETAAQAEHRRRAEAIAKGRNWLSSAVTNEKPVLRQEAHVVGLGGASTMAAPKPKAETVQRSYRGELHPKASLVSKAIGEPAAEVLSLTIKSFERSKQPVELPVADIAKVAGVDRSKAEAIRDLLVSKGHLRIRYNALGGIAGYEPTGA